MGVYDGSHGLGVRVILLLLYYVLRRLGEWGMKRCIFFVERDLWWVFMPVAFPRGIKASMAISGGLGCGLGIEGVGVGRRW